MIHLTHFFKRSEFDRNGENWYDLYDPRWLVLIDAFRLRTGKCSLSPHPRALGRRDGVNDRTGYDGHNIDKHGFVMAGDVFPHMPEGSVEYVDAYNSVRYAKKVGFTGIGLYPEWRKDGLRRFGLHLDTRRTVSPSHPATWGFIDGKFIDIETALNTLK